jgi:DNA ligase D-like protein (predicted 3'-phosphoesterase)
MMSESEPQFSIQKYENIDFHYVFHMEIGDGVRSWVVPKGPSPDPRVKRLAIPVDDDVDMKFEGIVEEGDREGRVIVWDSGPYRPVEIDGEPLSIDDGLEEGRIDFEIVGKKLRGGFTLLRIEDGANERWLLMKISDSQATRRRNPVVTEPLSVVSGRQLEEVSGPESARNAIKEDE